MNITVDPRLIKHLTLREKAFVQRDAQAMFRMGQLYARAKGQKAAKAAYRLFLGAAAKDHTDAQFALARCFEDGRGVRRDFRTAISWYVRSMVSAVRDAACTQDSRQLARLHRYFADPLFTAYPSAVIREEADMDGLSADALSEAAELGDPDAQDRLGVKYWYGADGLERDQAQAGAWLLRAAGQGCEAAMHHLAQHERFFGRYAEAVVWYRRCAELRLRWRNACLDCRE